MTTTPGTVKRFVQYLTTASFAIEVDVPGDTPADDVADVARELADKEFSEKHPGSLCWSCASDYDLGDFEQDETDGGVYE